MMRARVNLFHLMVELRQRGADAIAERLGLLVEPNPRPGVLEQLGRIDDPQVFFSAASYFATAPPEAKTKDVARAIRTLRRAVREMERTNADSAVSAEALDYLIRPPKIRLLIALGYMESPDELRAVAVDIAAVHPSEEEAIVMVERRRRLLATGEPSQVSGTKTE